MSPLEKIKRGILKKSWEEVCSGYTMLTGDSLEGVSGADSPKLIKVKPAAKPTAKSAAKKLKSKKKISVEEDEDRLDKEIVSKLNIKPRKNFLVSGKVNLQGVKPLTPFDIPALQDDEEKAVNKKIRKQRPRTPRPEYEPDYRNCRECGDKYDFNKAYPAGVLEKNHSKIMCSKCQNNYRG